MSAILKEGHPMTPLDLTQCPPPEGMEWHEDGCGGFIAQAPNRTLRIDPEAEEGIRVSAWNVDDNVHFYTTLAALPSAYRRALVAVGLTPPTPNLRARVEGVLTKLREWAEDEPVFSEAADLLEAAIKGDSP